MQTKRILPVIIFFILITNGLFAQQVYDLSQVINLAKMNSLSSLQAKNRKENRYWQYKTYQSNYKPQLSLDGSLPDFNSSISPVTQPDGTDIFIRRSLASSDLQLSISQAISATGGRIFAGTNVQRIDLYGDNRSTSYAASPLIFGVTQPVFGFNELKWDKRIEPIRYEESIKDYNEEVERVAIRASNLFFSLLLAQISLEISQKNKINNDTIYRIAEGRYELGKIAENELLQLELNLVNSEQQVRQARLDLETTMLNLNTFIGNPDNQEVTLIAPAEIPDFPIDVELAIQQAKKNRQQYLAFKRELMEAEREVAQAKGQSGLNVNVVGSFGLTSQSNTFDMLYNDMQDQQRLAVTFQIPIMDWGRQKAMKNTAIANQELVKNTVAQEEINFEQEIYTLVKQFPILREQLKASIRADEIAQLRYDISQQRYLVAKISITDLNIALKEKDEAKQNYLQSLRDFWSAYYTIRALTLYDFEQNVEITY
ncbi:TolC family protein [Flammeovirgaceae bacterium SG7u.111]|nr:TolC family protein [Flammeovirgaceae bacterium SG7u.132]WPO37065.1 TolC family protein [Flammeovirgaceae bacterium SG7u.111]